MTRRRVIQHEEESEPVKKKFSRTRFWDNQQNAEKISCGKVSKIFFYYCMIDTLSFLLPIIPLSGEGKERKRN